MIKKKICMLGSFAVGKTSLVKQFVHSRFSEKYLTTIGVKIDQKQMNVDGQEVQLLLWDIHGEDEFQKIPSAYLKGSAGYFIVIDGTRKATVEVAEKIRQMASDIIGNAPFLVLINKADLRENWDVKEDDLSNLNDYAIKIIETSAKTGQGVEEAFLALTKEMLA